MSVKARSSEYALNRLESCNHQSMELKKLWDMVKKDKAIVEVSQERRVEPCWARI